MLEGSMDGGAAGAEDHFAGGFEEQAVEAVPLGFVDAGGDAGEPIIVPAEDAGGAQRGKDGEEVLERVGVGVVAIDEDEIIGVRAEVSGKVAGRLAVGVVQQTASETVRKVRGNGETAGAVAFAAIVESGNGLSAGGFHELGDPDGAEAEAVADDEAMGGFETGDELGQDAAFVFADAGGTGGAAEAIVGSAGVDEAVVPDAVEGGEGAEGGEDGGQEGGAGRGVHWLRVTAWAGALADSLALFTLCWSSAGEG